MRQARFLSVLSWAVVVHCLCAATVHAAKVFVEPVTGAGVADNVRGAARELLESELREAGHEVVATEVDSDLVIRSSLIRLGEAYTWTARRVVKGATITTQKMKAAREDELDRVAARLARALVTETKVADNARIGEITENEANRFERRTVSKEFTYFGLGPAWLANMDQGDGTPAYWVGGGRSRDVNDRASIRFGGEMAFRFGVPDADPGGSSGLASLVVATIALHYHFLPTDISPFVGAAVGLGASYSHLDGRSFGFAGSAKAGATFFRTADTQLGLEAQYLSLFARNDSGFPGYGGIGIFVNF